MANQLRYDGKVVIVTGAGNGLGRHHALMFGARGAKVVINDLGGGAHGGGKSSAAADQVVEEIKALGGDAVANYDSVEDGAKIVLTALDTFGTVDIVINNAGILRDVSFGKMSEADWDIIYRVHLLGSMRVTHAAWEVMRAKGYGRVVMTTSAAGIYGNFGQANYSAAKLGLVGLANSLAIEGRNKNVHVNVIAPVAGSRLTETVLPPDLIAALRPEYVSPLVGWLSHVDCKETGGLFEVGAGFVGKLRWERTRGYSFAIGGEIRPEQMAAKWEAITDFSATSHPANLTESMGPCLENMSARRLGGNEFLDLDAAAADEVVAESSYDERDLSLYALGIGAARDATDTKELPYVYELGDGFQAFPTYGVMPALNAFINNTRDGKGLKGLNYGLDRVLHGEQFTEIMRPLPPKARLKHSFKLKNAFDKEKNALVILGVDTTDEAGERLAYNEITLFIRGAGGWGGERGPSLDINVPPERAPDAVVEEMIDDNQTLLYRLSGDWNPLHADPAFAKAFGFDKPILHGLCTYGFVGRHVVKAFCGNDGRRFKSIKVRFAESVFPGETLVTKMWKESDTRIVFETRVKERDKVVIRNAAVELYAQIPQAKKAAVAAQPAATAAVAAVANDGPLTATEAFEVLSAYVGSHPELSSVNTTFQFKVANPSSDWILDLKNGKAECRSGVADKPDCTLEMDEEHIETVVTRPMAEVQKLYFNGKLKIGGNIMASQKLTAIQGIGAAPYAAIKAKRAVVAAPLAVAAPAAVANDGPLSAAEAFEVLSDYVAQHPEIAAQVKTVFQFQIQNPESLWTLDLKNGKGSCSAGAGEKPDCTLEMDEEHIETVVTKPMADVQKLYFNGKLKIGGNIMASQKLTAIQGIGAKPYAAVKARRGGAPVVATAPAAKPAAVTAPQKPGRAGEVFAALGQRIAKDAKAINGLPGHVLQFELREPAASWVVDFGKSPTVSAGTNAQASAVFHIADEDLVLLASGQAEARDLFQRGRLRVQGDVRLARELGVLNKLI